MITIIGRRPGSMWRPSASAFGVFACALLRQPFAWHTGSQMTENDTRWSQTLFFTEIAVFTVLWSELHAWQLLMQAGHHSRQSSALDRQ